MLCVPVMFFICLCLSLSLSLCVCVCVCFRSYCCRHGEIKFIYCRLLHPGTYTDPATRWWLKLLQPTLERVSRRVRRSEQQLLAGKRADSSAEQGRQLQAAVRGTAGGLDHVVPGRVPHVHRGRRDQQLYTVRRDTRTNTQTHAVTDVTGRFTHASLKQQNRSYCAAMFPTAISWWVLRK